MGYKPEEAGAVVSSVSWNANTTTAGEATLAYKKNHLKAFRLGVGLWQIENMGTNPLMPGDSTSWLVNSLGGGVEEPFFVADITINAFGQSGTGHPVSMVISATNLNASSNTGNLGSLIVKIRDKDGIGFDPTSADAFASVKFTCIK